MPGFPLGPENLKLSKIDHSVSFTKPHRLEADGRKQPCVEPALCLALSGAPSYDTTFSSMTTLERRYNHQQVKKPKFREFT